MDETRGFLYLGHSNWTICSLSSWFCPKIFPSSWALYWGSHFLLPQRAENEKKGFTQKWMRHRGFCTLGIQTGPFAACWAGFVPNFSNYLIFILGSPFRITPERGKWEKGIHPKTDETQGFLYLGHSNWTICSQLTWFCPKIFPSSWLLYWGSGAPFLITPESCKWEKGIHPKVDETRGFLYLAHSYWIICRLSSWLYPKKFSSSCSLHWTVVPVYVALHRKIRKYGIRKPERPELLPCDWTGNR